MHFDGPQKERKMKEKKKRRKKEKKEKTSKKKKRLCVLTTLNTSLVIFSLYFFLVAVKGPGRVHVVKLVVEAALRVAVALLEQRDPKLHHAGEHCLAVDSNEEIDHQ